MYQFPLKYKIIFGLILLALTLFVIVQMILIPKMVELTEKRLSEEIDPLTQNILALQRYHSQDMGDETNFSNLLSSLALNKEDRTLHLDPENHFAEVRYLQTVNRIGEDKVQQALVFNATVLYILIEDLEGISFTFMDRRYQTTRSNVENWYGGDLLELRNPTTWQSQVLDQIEDMDYVQEAFGAIFSIQQ